MAVNNYKRYKIRTERLSGQGLGVGDLVQRQYLERGITVRTVMAVLSTGIDQLVDAQGIAHQAPYFIGALLEGPPPCNGELLDFVRMTSLQDPGRGGALYLSSSDAEAPFMDVVDGAGMERSLCRPARLATAGKPDEPVAYTLMGDPFLSASYHDLRGDAQRLCRLECTQAPPSEALPLGLRQCLPPGLGHPERLLVSFQVRASQPLGDVTLSVGYTSGQVQDATTTFQVTDCWAYQLHVITLEYPPRQPRCLTLDFAPLPVGAWVEVAALNVIRQSDALSLPAACKVRLGRISGIVDPLFGVLDGYGAYVRNLYATDNVNIAGTLTAGDERGFASTFYVGRIHKNVLRNSLGCDFRTPTRLLPDIPPAGIGRVHRLEAGDHVLACQSAAWAAEHAGERYCFSFWCRSAAPTAITVSLEDAVAAQVTAEATWRRRHVVFQVCDVQAQELTLHLCAAAAVDITSPQLEAGERPTLYQATDQVLQPTDDYGAWFSRGGIGGTIQNPLLRLNDDGSLKSANGSFVINPDGTGHFAGGRFRWSEHTIDLKGVTIRWEDFDDKGQEALLPKSVSICGPDTFHYADALEAAVQPAQITLVATEHNFAATERRWQYLTVAGTWQEAGSHAPALLLTPDFHGWEQREVLTVRFVATHEGHQYTATHTVTKLYDGKSAYSVYITADRGTILQNGTGATTLRAEVLRGAEQVTERIPAECFLWTRQSYDPEADALWNAAQHRGYTLTVQGCEVTRKAVFSCDVTLN